MTETPVSLQTAFDWVQRFDAMAYFPQVPGPARAMIAESLYRLVNGPCPQHTEPCECERPQLRNASGVPITKSPAERLKTFVEVFVRVPSGWIGIAEMEAIYGSLFPPGDGVERGSPVTPGYRWADHETGTHIPLLPAVPEDTKLLEQPEDVLTDEERRKLADQFTKALERLSGGSSCEE